MTKEDFIKNNSIEDGTIIIEPFDYYKSAIIGLNSSHTQICYSYEGLISCLEKEMNYEEAMEYVEYNILGTMVGLNSEYKPIIIYTDLKKDYE